MGRSSLGSTHFCEIIIDVELSLDRLFSLDEIIE
jgi:hypothetical protein